MDIQKEILDRHDISDCDEKNDKLKSNVNVDMEKINILNKQISDLELNLLDQELFSKNKLKSYYDRVKKEIDNAYKFALQDFFNALLPTIDNIERSLDLFEKKDDIIKPIFSELNVTLKSLMKLLTKFGLTQVNETCVPFNPDIHQAMTIQSSKKIKENYVISVMQKGYLLNGRLLRPAMVTVSKP